MLLPKKNPNAPKKLVKKLKEHPLSFAIVSRIFKVTPITVRRWLDSGRLADTLPSTLIRFAVANPKYFREDPPK